MSAAPTHELWAAGEPAPLPGRSGDDELRLARLHLRLGLLTLARAELEALAGRGIVDGDAQALLAEARWRTGGGEGAVGAARAHLAGGGSDEIAVCIAVEAAAAEGDMAEARQLMGRLGTPDPALVDRLFAGMPQRAAWPATPDTAAQVGDRERAASASVPTGHPNASPGRREGIDAGRPEREHADRGAWNAPEELRRARDELGVRPDRAFVRLALVLRLDPTLAPAVLDAIALRREPAAAVVRGDAQRLLGRHLEAEAAFDAAAESLEAK